MIFAGQGSPDGWRSIPISLIEAFGTVFVPVRPGFGVTTEGRNIPIALIDTF